MNTQSRFPGLLGAELERGYRAAARLRPGSVPGMLVSRTTRGTSLKPLRSPEVPRGLELVMVVKELRNALLCVRGTLLGDDQGNGIPQLGARPLDTAAFLVAKPPSLRQDLLFGSTGNPTLEFLPDVDPRRAFRRRRGQYPALMDVEVTGMGGPVTVQTSDLHGFSTNTQPDNGMNWVPPTLDMGVKRWITEEIDPPYLAGATPMHVGSATYRSSCYVYIQPIGYSQSLQTAGLVTVTGEETALTSIDFTDPPFADVFTVPVKPPIAVADDVLGGHKSVVKFVDANLDARRWRDIYLNNLAIDNLNDMGFYRTSKQEP